MKTLTFRLLFSLGSISDKLSSADAEEVSWKGDAYYFSVFYNSIDEYDKLEYILTIIRIYMKNNIK